MLALSNIAWVEDEEDAVADVIVSHGVRALEIAPTRVFPDPLRVDDRDLSAHLAFWSDRGVGLVAFQSMLFGRPDLELFGDQATRSAMLRHLLAFVELAGRMSVPVLVFGSPLNRRVPPDLPTPTAERIAIEFFSELAEAAEAVGTVVCIEPNPPAYRCNFVTTAAEGADLVQRVGRSGFALHLDLAGMVLAGDDPGTAIASHPTLRHFHISAPDLQHLAAAPMPHDEAARALRAIDYHGAVSIEMRPRPGPDTPERISQAIRIAQAAYGPDL